VSESIGNLAYDFLKEIAAQFQSHRDAAASGTEAEAVHQMRVSARRLRALIRAFAAILPEPIRELEPELRWIAGSLGAVRDADVFLEHHPDLRESVEPLRLARLETLRSDLDSERFSDLLLALRHRIEVRDFADPELAQTPISMAAPEILEIAFRRFRRARFLDVTESVHRLRRRAKRLRYTLDCFPELYGKPAKRFGNRLKSLQELLGAYNDSVVAEGILREIGVDRADERAKALMAELPAAIDAVSRDWDPLKRRVQRKRRKIWRA
jgi:CHAD domain-containing protein